MQTRPRAVRRRPGDKPPSLPMPIRRTSVRGETLLRVIVLHNLSILLNATPLRVRTGLWKPRIKESFLRSVYCELDEQNCPSSPSEETDKSLNGGDVDNLDPIVLDHGPPAMRPFPLLLHLNTLAIG